MEAFAKSLSTIPRVAKSCGYSCHQVAHASTTTPSPSLHPHPCTPTPMPLSPQGRVNRRTELDFEELRALQGAGEVALIDVRDSQDIENCGAIPGALNIPLCKIKLALQLSEEEWAREYNIEKPHILDRNLVFYARGPNASSAAVEIAHRLGFKKSRHYTGGWEDYCRRTGLPLKKSSQNGFGNYYSNNFDQYFL